MSLRRAGQKLASSLLSEAGATRAFATGSVEFKVPSTEVVSKLQALVRKFEDQNAQRNAKQWAEDLKAGRRTKEQHEYFEKFRARMEADKKEAEGMGLDPLAFSALRSMERWQEFETKVAQVPIPWEKLDDMAAIEAYVAQCEAIRSGLGLLSRAEEFAAISEVCQRASGGAVRKFRALLEAQVALPDNIPFNAAIEMTETETKKPLMFSDKDAMAKFEKNRKQIYSDMKVPYSADFLVAGFREQCTQVQAELKSRKEFRDAALQRVVRDLEEDAFGVAQ